MTKHLRLEQLVFSPVGLRIIDRNSMKYEETKQSIMGRGVLSPLTVRLAKDAYNRKKLYEVIDGNHRLAILKDLAYGAVACVVVKLDDTEVLCAQIRLNSDATQQEYIQQMRRILTREPNLKVSELANLIGWRDLSVRRTLLPGICRSVVNYVKNGSIGCTNACILQRLPSAEQRDWAERAMVLSPYAFVPMVVARLRELKRHDDAALEYAMSAKQFAEKHRALTNDSFEMVHGVKSRHFGGGVGKAGKVTVAEDAPIQRKGWDHVQFGGQRGYCRGDLLVTFTGKWWVIHHPKILRLANMSFADAVEAMEFVEQCLNI